MTPHSPTPSWRARLDAGVESPAFQAVTIALVIVNAILLGLETLPSVMTTAGPWLTLADRVLLTIEGRNAKSRQTRYMPLNDEAISVLRPPA